jgi:hypothetical protein
MICSAPDRFGLDRRYFTRHRRQMRPGSFRSHRPQGYIPYSPPAQRLKTVVEIVEVMRLDDYSWAL